MKYTPEQITELLEEVRTAREAATPGPWIHSPGDHIDEPAAVYILLDELHVKTIADNLLGVDAHLIANAPTWLKQFAEIVQQQTQLIERMRIQADINIDIGQALISAQEEIEQLQQQKDEAGKAYDNLLAEAEALGVEPQGAITMKTYKVIIRGREQGTIKTEDIKKFVEENYPGARYEVDEENATLHLSVSLLDAMRICKASQETE